MPAPRVTQAQWEARLIPALQQHPGSTEAELRGLVPGGKSLPQMHAAVTELLSTGRIRREKRIGPGGGWRLYAVQPTSAPSLEGDEPIEVLIERRRSKFAEVRKAYRHQTAVNLPDDKPIAIWHCGDPHVDDDGTDLDLLYHHAEVVRSTPGMWAGNVGDTTNNWVGRLSRLYGQQSTTARDAWRLAEDFIRRAPWLYMVAGNHDQWSGSGDPLQWITRLCGAPAPELDARLTIRWPTAGDMKVWVRHDFPGRSQWNAAHGAGKAARTSDADLLVCGHMHQCGHQTIGHEDGSVSHALQVGSYKAHDRYQRERGFSEAQHFSPCACTILDPSATGADRVQVVWDPERAARILTALRGGK